MNNSFLMFPQEKPGPAVGNLQRLGWGFSPLSLSRREIREATYYLCCNL